MPQRLPKVNSDDGTWGTILNQYITKEHYQDPDPDADNPDNGMHETITIRAGTATAGTAPLKFTSGTVLGTPEAGAMEYNTSSLYFTITGPTRKTIAWTTPRSTSIASSATPSIDTDIYDAYSITALATGTTISTTGTPTNFQKLIVRIKDNTSVQTIAWTGSNFEAKGKDLPTTTVSSKVLTVGFIYDSVTTKWGCVAVAQEA